jgi:hypothetical protein
MMHVFSHIGAPPKQACPKSVVAGDLSKPHPLPGVVVPDDPEKTPAIAPTSTGLTWPKVLFGGVVVYAAGKVFGIFP